jgi:hypothetical protein
MLGWLYLVLGTAVPQLKGLGLPQLSGFPQTPSLQLHQQPKLHLLQASWQHPIFIILAAFCPIHGKSAANGTGGGTPFMDSVDVLMTSIDTRRTTLNT